jgi:hypothetical protein
MGGIGRRALLTLPGKALAILLWRSVPAEAAPRSVGLPEFLKLSTRLTGHKGLDPGIAKVYLAALLADAGKRSRLADLVGGRPHADLEREIVQAWYTGIYDAAGEKRLATHRQALMWKSLGVAPPSTCGGPFGFWARPPAEPR